MGRAIGIVIGCAVGVAVACVVACGSDGSNGNGSAPDGGAASSSGGSSGGGSSGATGSSGGLCPARTSGVDLATYADRICKAFTPCCPSYGYPIDDARCRKFFTQTAQYPDLVFDPVKAEECVLAWEANAKVDTFCRSTPTPFVCTDVWKRCATAGPPASQCKSREDCALSDEGFVSCENVRFDAPGFCRLEVHAKQGEPCDGWARRYADPPYFENSGPPEGTTRVSVCYQADGLFCDTTADKCDARRAIGQPCVFNEWCVEGAFCTGNKCEALRTANQPCFDSRDCASDLYCDAAKQCVPKKALGAQCERFDACIHRCENGTCVDLPSTNAVYLAYCGLK